MIFAVAVVHVNIYSYVSMLVVVLVNFMFNWHVALILLINSAITILEQYECEHHCLLQMVDYQMLKEDNSVLRRELDGMKT